MIGPVTLDSRELVGKDYLWCWTPNPKTGETRLCDPELESNPLETLNSAVDYWNEWAGCDLFAITDSDHSRIRVFLETNTGRTQGWAGHENLMINQMTYAPFNLMLHELGHTIGLRHSGYKASIMYPALRRDSSLDGLTDRMKRQVQDRCDVTIPLSLLDSYE